MPRDRDRTLDLSPLDLSPAERRAAVVRLLAAALLRLSHRRLSTPENLGTEALSGPTDFPQDSGASGLA